MTTPTEGGAPQNPAPGTVQLTEAEYNDLKHRASESSQNFERLKKAEEARATAEEQVRFLQDELLKAKDNPSDPGKIAELEKSLEEVKAGQAKAELLERYPILKEHWQALMEYRQLPENKGMNLNTAAKVFLSDKGLLETRRAGLETPSGGEAPPTDGSMTPEQIADLRMNHPEKYRDMIMKDQIKY